jgi:hypothetical protein
MRRLEFSRTTTSTRTRTTSQLRNLGLTSDVCDHWVASSAWQQTCEIQTCQGEVKAAAVNAVNDVLTGKLSIDDAREQIKACTTIEGKLAIIQDVQTNLRIAIATAKTETDKAPFRKREARLRGTSDPVSASLFEVDRAAPPRGYPHGLSPGSGS